MSTKHQPIEEHAEIQRNTHYRIIKPGEMYNKLSPCERKHKYDLEPTQQRHSAVWSREHVLPGPHMYQVYTRHICFM